MKEEYLKMVTKHMAKDLKPMMRDGIKRLYHPELELGPSNFHAVTHVTEDGELDQDLIEEDVMDFIYHAIITNQLFGDYNIEKHPVTDGNPEPKKTWVAITVTLPVERC